ncbi:MAG: glycosyltransferase family 2 protein [Butyrivibrio sp.]|jgi:glycosyltransferase involved in cell wall biosynthesis|nr:glycosyltransferase family 2 protein [Butyrivibrio sp.]
MDAKVSVLMPVYNVQSYLKECLDSAVNQTYRNIEIVCIDDGSKDDSARILDEYSEKYNFIKVLHKKNTGYGNSMNIALDLATGDYISILEPDDYISPDAISHILTKFEENPCVDFIKCNFIYLYGNKGEYLLKKQRIWDDHGIYGKILSGKEIHVLYRGYVAHWSAVYRSEFLKKNNIRFNETPGASYQDFGFWFQTLMFAENVYMDDAYFYHYRQDNPGSSMNNSSKIYCIFDECDYIQRIMCESGKKDEVLADYIRCRYAAGRDTFFRINFSDRRAFLNRMHDDFVKLKDEKMLDTDELSESEKSFLSELIESSDEFWKKHVENLYNIKRFIETNEEYYVYGAGKTAAEFIKCLEEEDKRKLKAFLVSNAPDQDSYLGFPVISIAEEKNALTESAIVVAVTEQYVDEIVNYLKQFNINNYICIRNLSIW